jgi:hypothetical protein
MTLANTSTASVVSRCIRELMVPTQTGIITQIKSAWACKPALLLGAIWGGFVPTAVFEITHVEGIDLRAPFEQWDPLHYVVVAGLAFSATSVWNWGRTLYHAAKSAVFVGLLEGTMILCHTTWLSYFALTMIIVTNMMIVGARAAEVEEIDSRNEDVDPIGMPSLPAKIASEDLLYTKALELAQSGNCSINFLKRSLGIGWDRAAALGDRLEREGFAAKGGKRTTRTLANGSWQSNPAAQG